MTPGEKIMALLAMLSEQSGDKVSAARIEFMTRNLLPHGADAVIAALEKLLKSARRFPTVADVESAMGICEASPEDKGREVANRIFYAIERWGDMNGESGVLKWENEIAPYLGPIGCKVVTVNGGWNYLCSNVTNDDATTWKAQWRDYACSLARGHVGDEAPDFATLHPRVNDAIKALVEKHTI